MSTGEHQTPDERTGRALGHLLRHSPATPPERVAAALTLVHGMNQAQLAEVLDRHRVHVGYVIQGHRSSPPLRAAIAKFLGVSVSDIWPSDDASLPRPAGRENGSEQQEITR